MIKSCRDSKYLKPYILPWVKEFERNAHLWWDDEACILKILLNHIMQPDEVL